MAIDTSSSAAPMLRLERVSKWFAQRDGNPLHVLQDIDITVETNSIVALLGASGCGKSTLLNIVAGLVTPDRGRVFLEGKPASESFDWRAMTYMFQEDRLLPWRTALQNVAFGLEALNVPRAQRIERAAQALNMVGLDKFASAFPHELSGGMRSRVALARSLVTRPKLLLMDEPFSKLDPSIRSHMHTEVLRLARMTSTTVLFVTHDIEEAAVLADRIVLLQPRPGRVREAIEVDLAHPRHAASPDVVTCVQAIRQKMHAEATCA